MTDIDKNALTSDSGALRAFNRRIVEEFRATQGYVQGVPGGSVLLLHSIGAKTDKQRLHGDFFGNLGHSTAAGSATDVPNICA